MNTNSKTELPQAGDRGYIPNREVLNLWAQIRCLVPMAAIIEMARQDVEVMSDGTSSMDECEVFEQVIALLGQAQCAMRKTQR
ncbi:MAG TPA: hypothetical protein VIE65_04220 [Methylobacter sp.]|jgi:hypothetical protein